MLALIDCGSKRIPCIIALLQRLQMQLTQIPLKDANNTDFTIFNTVLISGGPHLFTRPGNTLMNSFTFIERLNIPAFGICLGLQAIGLTHGARIFRAEPRRTQDRIQFHKEHPLLNGLQNNGPFAEDHCEGITLPPGFALLGSSEHYPVEIMANDELQRYGVQFHPEASGERGFRLLENFLNLARIRPSVSV